MSKSGAEIGYSGTRSLAGIITEEYNSKLSGATAMGTYDEMRKSDGTVRAGIQAMTLPIRKARWYLKPASEDQADIDIAEFVEQNLMEGMSLDWDSFLRQALLQLSYGVMVFEKVFEIKNVNGVDRIVWSKFAPRLPRSIYTWQLTNGEDGIQQYGPSGQIFQIPMEKLIVFVNEKEGDNWWGTSTLRAAYKHWYFKNTLYQIDAIAAERQGLGVPFGKVPANTSDADKKKLGEMLRRLRAHEEGYVIFETEQEVGFLDMKGSTTKDIMPSIEHHNHQILLSMLAQFLMLGTTKTGARSTSEDHQELFLASLEAVANGIKDAMNKYAIKQLVDFNFDVKEYPKLEYAGISRTDAKALADAYASLVTSGGIKAQGSDETYFRELLKLPEVEEDREEVDDGDEQDENIDDELDNVDVDEDGKLKKKSKTTDDEVTTSELVIREALKDYQTTAEKITCCQAYINNPEEDRETRAAATKVFKELTRKQFQETNDFKSFRKLTFAEKKVDFQRLNDVMDELEKGLATEAIQILKDEKEKYLGKLENAIRRGDTKAVKALTLEAKAGYARILKDTMRKSYTYGKNNAAREMGKSAPADDKVILSNIDILASEVADNHAAQLQYEAKRAVVEGTAKGATVAATIGAADAVIDAKIEKLVRDTGSIVVGGYINQGRRTVFTKYEDDIHALQRSEILDLKTCNYCLSVDGRVIEKTDSFVKNDIFHSNCRGIWVEILKDEEELPEITGIPQTLKDRFGGTVNDLIQPKNPQTKKGTLADKFNKKRK